MILPTKNMTSGIRSILKGSSCINYPFYSDDILECGGRVMAKVSVIEDCEGCRFYHRKRCYNEDATEGTEVSRLIDRPLSLFPEWCPLPELDEEVTK